MDIELPTCKACYEDFDLTTRLPRMLPDCGHTVCSSCLSSILKSEGIIRCPQDRIIIQNSSKTVESFSVNFALREIIEGRSLDGLCPKHNEKKKYVCITDRKPVCAECVVAGDHAGHKLKSMRQLEAQLKEKVVVVEQAVQQLESHLQDTLDVIEKIRTSFTKTVTCGFEDMRRILAQKEVLLLHEMNSALDADKEDIIKQLGKDSIIGGTLARKINEYKNPFKQEDVVTLMEEDLQGIIPELHSDDFKTYLNGLKVMLNSSVQRWDDFLKQQAQNLYEMNMPMDDIAQMSIDLCKKVSQQPSEVAMRTKSGQISVNTKLKIQLEGDKLCVSFKEKEPSDAVIHIKDIIAAKKLSIVITEYNFNRQDLAAFYYTCGSVKSISSLEISCCSGLLPNNILADILYYASLNTRQIFELSLDLDCCRAISDEGSSFFIEYILPKMVNLENLNLNFQRTRITNKTLITLAKHNISIIQALRSFKLNLDNSLVTDEGLAQILIPMPAVTNYSLCLSSIKVTDKCVNLLTRQILSNFTGIEDLCLDLTRTEISHRGLAQILRTPTLHKLKKFTLRLGLAPIMDQTIEILATDCLPNMENLVELELGLDRVDYINDEDLQCIHAPLQVLQSKSLASVVINLQATDITDEGVISFLQGLDNLTYLEVGLGETIVSNKVVEEFVDKVLPRMKLLKDFKLSLEGTQISRKTIADLNEHRKRLSEMREDD